MPADAAPRSRHPRMLSVELNRPVMRRMIIENHNPDYVPGMPGLLNLFKDKNQSTWQVKCVGMCFSFLIKKKNVGRITRHNAYQC